MSEISLSAGMRWSGISVVGREAARMIFTIILARIVGPEAFGIVAQAVVFMVVIGLLLDQGFASALIQRPRLAPELPGAIASVTLAIGAAVAALTITVAPEWAAFMNSPELTLVLTLLAPSLLIRAASVTPRGLLLRRMAFREVGIAEIVAATVGGALGVAAAVFGAGYWALVVQIVSTDAVLLLMFLSFGAGTWPNLRLSSLREIAAFSGRAFAAGVLTTVARNVDNLLVGRYQGAESLAFYALGYRLLLFPVQLLSSTVGGVFFPAFSRLADDLEAVRSVMSRATRSLAALVLPGMALLAAAAPDLVVLLFGTEWEPAVRIVQVLAVAGAVQAIYQPSTVPMILGLGHAGLTLKYAVLTTGVAIIGIVAGVPFSPLAVAIGYTAATVALVPVEWIIRRRLLGMPVFGQARSLLTGVHVAVWTAAAYTAVAAVVGSNELAALAAGTSAAVLVGVTVLRVAHRRQFAELAHITLRLLGRTRGSSVAAQGAGGV